MLSCSTERGGEQYIGARIALPTWQTRPLSNCADAMNDKSVGGAQTPAFSLKGKGQTAL